MRSVNINQFQASISKIIRLVEKGEDYEVIRYSKPVAVVLSGKKYEKILQELVELKSSCRECVDEFKKSKSRMIPNVTRISRISKKY